MPLGAYGFTTLPTNNNWLIRNATVWTNEAEGILEETDVLVKNGKIAAVGKQLDAGGAEVIDGSGMHLTCGIIDEHSFYEIDYLFFCFRVEFPDLVFDTSGLDLNKIHIGFIDFHTS